MTKTEKILKLLEDNGLCVYDLAKAYWEIAIDDNISCCSDYENMEMSQEEYDIVVEDVMSDDEMWNKVSDTIDYYIKHDVIAKRGDK